jgi:hypothetical protein
MVSNDKPLYRQWHTICAHNGTTENRASKDKFLRVDRHAATRWMGRFLNPRMESRSASSGLEGTLNVSLRSTLALAVLCRQRWL